MSYTDASPYRPFSLVTFTQAKAHLNVDHDLDDELIDDQRKYASWIMLDYLKSTLVIFKTNGWIDNFDEPTFDVPGNLVSATLLVLGALYENRDGDAWRSPQPLSQAVLDLVWRLRDPSMA